MSSISKHSCGTKCGHQGSGHVLQAVSSRQGTEMGTKQMGTNLVSLKNKTNFVRVRVGTGAVCPDIALCVLCKVRATNTDSASQ